jgi:5'-nucleotidase
MQFILLEDNSSGYVERTEVNAKSADVTFAIALHFDSAGEKLTKRYVLEHSKLYIPISPIGDISTKIAKIVTLLNDSFAVKRFITLNVAGNGLATMKGEMKQEACDDFTYQLLSGIINHPGFKLRFKTIRSGGQTGFDEAGLKAAIKLNIDSIAYYPKGYKIRDLEGDKVQTRKEVFKRYGLRQKIRLYIDMDGVLCDFRKSYYEWKDSHPDITYPQSQFGFFTKLEPIPGGIEAVHELEKHYEVHILTRPSVYNLMCYTEKAEWVRNYLGFEFLERLNLCPDKSIANGAVLIDDSVEYGQLDFEGELIQFGSKEFPDWQHVLNYLIK